MTSNAVITRVRGKNNLPTKRPMLPAILANLLNLNIIFLIRLPDDLIFDIILPTVFCQRLLSKSPTSSSILVKPLNLRFILVISLAILPSSATLKKVFTLANWLVKKRLISSIIMVHRLANLVLVFPRLVFTSFTKLSMLFPKSSHDSTILGTNNVAQALTVLAIPINSPPTTPREPAASNASLDKSIPP